MRRIAEQTANERTYRVLEEMAQEYELRATKLDGTEMTNSGHHNAS